jgi:hypothetical protein
MPDKKRYPVPHWRLGMWLTSCPCKNSVVSKTQQWRGLGSKMGQSAIEEEEKEELLGDWKGRQVAGEESIIV